ncbi:nucleotidyltransferase domain-containing protein [Candidatus Poribacteria bacterium]|nr:MAG: nucleotidyltransferase domain-containing protein [Candidatus Poribacteria bacterium]
MTAEQERQAALLLKDQILAGTDQPIRQIILYGSRAQGRERPDSDFDLLVVAADPVVKGNERQRLRAYLTDVPYEVDVWVMGETEFEETKEVIGGLAFPAHKYGVVLHEAS